MWIFEIKSHKEGGQNVYVPKMIQGASINDKLYSSILVFKFFVFIPVSYLFLFPYVTRFNLGGPCTMNNDV